MSLHLGQRVSFSAVLVGAWLTLAGASYAQPLPGEPLETAFAGGPTVSDSSVGYIDDAIPGNIFRLRFDAAYDNRRPTRAEFFYAQGGPGNPGPPLPETSVDYQDITAYLEYAVNERLSLFVESPWRFIDPQVNANANGYADMNAGFKYAFIYSPDTVATFQFRVWMPTGDADQGLGNELVSLEPGLLLYHQLTDRLCFEGELRDWIPIDGTDFAGNVIRYGAGLHYDLCQYGCTRFVPVVEFVGWTVLDGKERVVPLPGLVGFVEDAAGDTIVNAKVGLRVKFGDAADLYGGYGRALTGDTWYEDIFRLEFRLFY